MIAFAKQFEPPVSLDEVLKLAVAKMLADIAKNDAPATIYHIPYTCVACGGPIVVDENGKKCPKCGKHGGIHGVIHPKPGQLGGGPIDP